MGEKENEGKKVMALLVVVPIYILANAYILYHLHLWVIACVERFSTRVVPYSIAAIFVFMASCIFISAIMPTGSAVQHVLKSISNYWLGIMMYSIALLIICDVVYLIFWLIHKHSPYQSKWVFIPVGIIVIVLVSIVCISGYFHAKEIKVNEYNISVNKNAGENKSLRIALIADSHLGYNVDYGQMKEMVEKINAQNVDIVLYAGDIFDNEFSAIYEPEKIADLLATLKSRYGTYACWGNHDVDEVLLAGFTISNNAEENDSEYLSFLKRANIQLLEDEQVLIDDSFYVIGRKDLSRSRRMDQSRKTAEDLTNGLDETRPVFVIDHQPREYEELARAGVDVDFSGHTHDGQMFPGNLLTSLLYKNSHGYYVEGDMQTFTTAGVGLWGPNMRVGTDSEIMIINITFQNN